MKTIVWATTDGGPRSERSIVLPVRAGVRREVIVTQRRAGDDLDRTQRRSDRKTEPLPSTPRARTRAHTARAAASKSSSNLRSRAGLHDRGARDERTQT